MSDGKSSKLRSLLPMTNIINSRSLSYNIGTLDFGNFEGIGIVFFYLNKLVKRFSTLLFFVAIATARFDPIKINNRDALVIAV